MVSSIPCRITAALLLLPVVACWAQEREQCATDLYASPAPRQFDKTGDWRVIRSFEDASTHQSWTVVRDKKQPAAPARLWGPTILRGAGCASAEESREALLQTASRLIIHAGDSLIVDEHTAIVDARLEATALNAAAGGERLKIRLKIGNRIVEAVAIEPGRAEMVPAMREARP